MLGSLICDVTDWQPGGELMKRSVPFYTLRDGMTGTRRCDWPAGCRYWFRVSSTRGGIRQEAAEDTHAGRFITRVGKELKSYPVIDQANITAVFGVLSNCPGDVEDKSILP
jgi:hypothetical protein